MTTIGTIAKTIDELVHRSTDEPFEIYSRLYGCDDDGAYLLAQHSSPYDLLLATERPKQLNAMALVVVGWASPDGSDLPPSQHPERFRMRLVNCLSGDDFAVVMRRADKPDQAEDLGNQGQGALRDAMEAWWNNAIDVWWDSDS